MKNKTVLLLAGAVTLSLLLSACGSQAGGLSDPDPAGAPAPSTTAEQPNVEPAAAPSDEVTVPSAQPTQEPEPTQAAESARPSPTQDAVVQTAAPTPPPVTQKPAVSTPTPVTPAPATPAPATPAPTPVPTQAPPAATKEAASAFIGQNVSNLIAAIGQPSGRSYAPSCLGDGEDGELFYNGFTVYTYREGGVETVQDVI